MSTDELKEKIKKLWNKLIKSEALGKRHRARKQEKKLIKTLIRSNNV